MRGDSVPGTFAAECNADGGGVKEILPGGYAMRRALGVSITSVEEGASRAPGEQGYPRLGRG
ncbi:hypothetical protein ACIQZB_13635 [Streptomyces sp. NPDC097727]|uniref:hypothetical protein n=1 Tax=Streptomyces sp. NPDC097727 TaxID=3366092 RepID=UPI00383026D4